MKIYAAYGSNINLEQMSHRCPDAVPIGKGWLMNYHLLFRGLVHGGVATVEPRRGRRVPILLWAITEKCEKALDVYEGFPSLYRKETVSVEGIKWLPNEMMAMSADVNEALAMIYIINTGEMALPSDYYLNTIARGYRAVGFHVRYLAEGVRRTQRRKVKQRAVRGKQ